MSEPPKQPRPPITPEEVRTRRVTAREASAAGCVMMIGATIGLIVAFFYWANKGDAAGLGVAAFFLGVGFLLFVGGKIFEDAYKGQD
jgi:hypothetical protein